MSEKVIVELNVTKLPIFFLPGKLHLSLENPGPAELDKTQISPAEKFMLNRASMLGQITLSGAVKSVSALESKFVEEQKPAPKPQEIKDQVLSKRQEVVEKLQKLSIQELSKEVQTDF